MARPRRHPAFAILRLTALVACLGGCNPDARSLVESMGRAYRIADRYTDAARVKVVRTRGDVTTEETHPFGVAFHRPDELRIEAYGARVVADGSMLRAAVGDVPGQVLTERVTSPLTLDQLFADGELRDALAAGVAGCPTQLPLLLADDTVGLILGDATGPPRLVGTETVDGHPCHRVAIPKADGTLDLWIDRERKLLRRMRVPTDAYAALLSQQSGAVTGVSVVVDFVSASFTSPAPAEAFAFEVPAGAEEVPRLAAIRPPRPASPLVGRRVEAFTLAGPDGRSVGSPQLGGVAAVLEFFFKGCEDATRTMPEVAGGIGRFHAVRRTAGRPPLAVAHLAVSIDDANVTADELRRQLAEYGGVGRLVRDPHGDASAALGLEEFPATVILGRDGTVADVIVGEHDRIAADVADALATVVAGDDVARAVRDRQAARLQAYTQRLTRAAGDGAGPTTSVPGQVIAPRRQPVRFKLTPAWRAMDVALPGNLVCLDASRGGGDEPRVVVLDGWRTAVELDAAGVEVSRHDLAIPEGATVRFLRTAVDGAGGRWWLGGARGARHVFAFDADWKLHATFPTHRAGQRDGLSAAQLLDTDGDGMPEIVVGSSGTSGLQAAALDGTRLWETRSPGAVLDLARGPSGDEARGLWCVAGDGRIVPLSLAGSAGAALGTSGWRLRSLVSGPVATDGRWAAAGVAGTGRAGNVAVGIDARGNVTWELPLADGNHRAAHVEPIAWADLLGTSRRQWLIAAPDGAVTVAWADGGVVDTYRHGEAITGIGGFRHGGDGYIVIATRTALEAFRMEDIALD